MSIKNYDDWNIQKKEIDSFVETKNIQKIIYYSDLINKNKNK
jgi:hypothetical protein